MSIDPKAREVIQGWERDDSERSVHLTHWQEIANYGSPYGGDYIVERTPGQKRLTYIYDATPLMALDQLAAGLHSLLTSTSLQWFYLLTGDERLDGNSDNRQWLEKASAAMYDRFNSARLNFASQSYEVYTSLGSIGNSVMAVLENKDREPLFSTRHMKECTWRLNEEDRVDHLTRNWKTWTAKQAVDQWGADALKRAACEQVLKAHADGDTRKFRFLHQVKPRLKRDPQRGDNRNMAFESVYVAFEDGALIQESGFREFPYLPSRFAKLPNEIYGHGPMMIALPDMKMLYELVKIFVKASQKILDPPLQVPDDGFLMAIKTVPGAFNYYRANTQARIEPIKTGGDLPSGVEMINGLRQQILKEMYVEWMIMPSNPADPAAAGKGITATYVLQQRDEKMRLLAPMLARLQAEFLGPLIDRTFAILWRKSVAMKFGPGSPFPMPPQALMRVPLKVEYVSPIALAQKSSQMDGVTRLLQYQEQITQMDPEGVLIIDPEAVMRLAQRDWNAPAATLKNPQRLQQETQQRNQAAAQAQQASTMAQGAGAAKDGAQAVKHLADAHATVNGAGGDQGDQSDQGQQFQEAA